MMWVRSYHVVYSFPFFREGEGEGEREGEKKGFLQRLCRLSLSLSCPAAGKKFIFFFLS